MTKYDLLDVIGTLDEKYLKEAEQRAQNQYADNDEEEIIMTTNNTKTKKMPKYFGATIAAALVLIAGTGVFLFNKGNGGLTAPPAGNSGLEPAVTQITGTVSETTDTQAVNTTATVLSNITTAPVMTAAVSTAEAYDPNANVMNVFGGKGTLKIVEADSSQLILRDTENYYIPRMNMKFTLNEEATYDYIGRVLPDDSRVITESIFSDGREVYYYGKDRKIYRLSYDYTKWVEYADLSGMDFVSEYTGIDGCVSFGDLRLFVFEHQMNLNILDRQFACVYNQVTGEWSKLVDAEGEMLHAASWHFDEANWLFVVCQQSEGNTAKHDFLFYNPVDNLTEPVKSFRNVETFDKENGNFTWGDGAFVGLGSEWNVMQGKVYFKSLENPNETFSLYKIADGMTAAEKISDQCGKDVISDGISVFTYYDNALMLFDIVGNDKVVKNVLLNDLKGVESIAYHNGVFVIPRNGKSQNLSDILVYSLAYEDELLMRDVTPQEYALESINVLKMLKIDGNDMMHSPVLARKPLAEE